MDNTNLTLFIYIFFNSAFKYSSSRTVSRFLSLIFASFLFLLAERINWKGWIKGYKSLQHVLPSCSNMYQDLSIVNFLISSNFFLLFSVFLFIVFFFPSAVFFRYCFLLHGVNIYIFCLCIIFFPYSFYSWLFSHLCVVFSYYNFKKTTKLHPFLFMCPLDKIYLVTDSCIIFLCYFFLNFFISFLPLDNCAPEGYNSESLSASSPLN